MKRNRGYFVLHKSVLDIPEWPEIFDAICDNFKNIKTLEIEDMPVGTRPIPYADHFILEMEHPKIDGYGPYLLEIVQEKDANGNNRIFIHDIIKC